MRSLYFIAIVFVVAIAGCTTSHQINGNYRSDSKYYIASLEETKLDSETVERLATNGPKIIISYPEMILTSYGTSFDEENNTTHVTETCQTNEIKKINNQLYLMVKETSQQEVYLPIYFDDEGGCAYLVNYKFIKER